MAPEHVGVLQGGAAMANQPTVALQELLACIRHMWWMRDCCHNDWGWGQGHVQVGVCPCCSVGDSAGACTLWASQLGLAHYPTQLALNSVDFGIYNATRCSRISIKA